MLQSSYTVTPKIVILSICEERAGQRIDNFLMSQLKGVPKSRIYRLLRKGEVRVNKGRIKADYRLQVGDSVRIPPVRTAPRSHINPPNERVASLIRESTVYEDAAMLIINKPAGLAVHGGSGLSYGVIEALRMIYPEAKNLELVHRLDKHTSGCLLIAKKRSVLRQLHDLFRCNQVQKRYVALLKGRWQGGKQQVNAPLLKNTLRSGERVVRVDPQGKAALSIFRPIRVFSDASLVEVEILSGRTHQIRVHAASIGYPIAGDEKYGHNGFNQMMKLHGLHRLFLHAKSLKLTLPEASQSINVVSALGETLTHVLHELGKGR
ncbi:MAG: 23S rRNA pseudouridine(955/2504/2580) synthase RluC [Gammaproteobacteria bacterium]|nr:23S rRNA pseudouridine(955/2504/2580) synthase RluC [Gammaproteobacteria bacterium]